MRRPEGGDGGALPQRPTRGGLAHPRRRHRPHHHVLTRASRAHRRRSPVSVHKLKLMAHFCLAPTVAGPGAAARQELCLSMGVLPCPPVDRTKFSRRSAKRGRSLASRRQWRPRGLNPRGRRHLGVEGRSRVTLGRSRRLSCQEFEGSDWGHQEFGLAAGCRDSVERRRQRRCVAQQPENRERRRWRVWRWMVARIPKTPTRRSVSGSSPVQGAARETTAEWEGERLRERRRARWARHVGSMSTSIQPVT